MQKDLIALSKRKKQKDHQTEWQDCQSKRSIKGPWVFFQILRLSKCQSDGHVQEYDRDEHK